MKLFGHVYRRSVDAVVKMSDILMVDGSSKSQGQIQLTLEAVVQKVLGFLDIMENDAVERTQWRQQIYIPDPD